MLEILTITSQQEYHIAVVAFLSHLGGGQCHNAPCLYLHHNAAKTEMMPLVAGVWIETRRVKYCGLSIHVCYGMIQQAIVLFLSSDVFSIPMSQKMLRPSCDRRISFPTLVRPS